MPQILARSLRQAMDWSLALLSQGIECVIQHPPETGEWELVVPDSNYQAALECIHQYRLENRGWPFRYQVPHSKFIFDWTSLALAALCLFFFWFNSFRDLHSAGLMDSLLVAKGQWWRLFTAVWLHADV